jgi:hypothetical protein
MIDKLLNGCEGNYFDTKISGFHVKAKVKSQKQKF